MFVLLEGGTREEAFALGDEIAARVTAQNPSPVRLKFEKVYHPCVLQTKKVRRAVRDRFDAFGACPTGMGA